MMTIVKILIAVNVHLHYVCVCEVCISNSLLWRSMHDKDFSLVRVYI